MFILFGAEKLLLDAIRDDSGWGSSSYGDDEDELMGRVLLEDYEIEKPKAISTLQCGSLLPLRQCGNTTRQIDWAIQQLFSGRVVQVKDHHLGGTDRKANENMWHSIIERLTTNNIKELVTNWVDNRLYAQICFSEEHLKKLHHIQKNT